MRQHIPGVAIPDEIVFRLDAATDAHEEGVRVCVETIDELRAIEGVAGIHVMAFRHAGAVGEILARAGLGKG